MLAPVLHGYGNSCSMVVFVLAGQSVWNSIGSKRSRLIALVMEYHGHVPTWPAGGQLNVPFHF